MVWGSGEVKTLHNATALPRKENLSDSHETNLAMNRNLHESECGRHAFAYKKQYAAAFLSVGHVPKSASFERVLFGRRPASKHGQTWEDHAFKKRAPGPHTLHRIYIEASQSARLLSKSELSRLAIGRILFGTLEL